MRIPCRLLLAALLSACGPSEPPKPPAIEWVHDLHAGLTKAREQKKPALVEFRATTCRESQALEAGPFANLRVIEASRAFVAIQVDVAQDTASAVAYRASVTPDVRFLDAEGRELGRLRMRKPGAPWDAAAVAEQMREAGSRH